MIPERCFSPDAWSHREIDRAEDPPGHPRHENTQRPSISLPIAGTSLMATSGSK
jgi:hypothetical protein